MPLKAIIETIDDVAAALRPLYRAGEGAGFVLDIEGLEDHPAARALKNALEAERDGRRRATGKAEALARDLERFAGIDADAARVALAGEESRDGDVEALVRAGVERQGAAFAEQRQGLETARLAAEEAARQAQGELAEARLTNAVLLASAEHGVRRAAIADVLARAGGVWRLDDDGKAVAIRDGKPVVGADGETPLTLDAWLAALATEAPHLFEPSRGGDAGGARLDGGLGLLGEVVGANAIGRNLEAVALGEARLPA